MFKTTEWKLPVLLKAMLPSGCWDSKEAVNVCSSTYLLKAGTAALQIALPSYTFGN